MVLAKSQPASKVFRVTQRFVSFAAVSLVSMVAACLFLIINPSGKIATACTGTHLVTCLPTYLMGLEVTRRRTLEREATDMSG